jgi:hypothetical protein
MLLGRSGGPLGNASITPLEPRVDSNGEPYFPILYNFPIGTGHSIKENSALVKPFRNILNEGKPAEKIVFVFYQENDNRYFVLGSFVNTIANRILFFPGLTFSRIIHTPDGKDLTNEELHTIDHFTLQKENLTKWHVTSLEKRTQGIQYSQLKTKKVNDDAYLWFLMAIPDASKLEIMPKTQEYRLKGPNTDMKRRFQNMVESVEDKEFPVVLINYIPPSPNFLNFEVFVSNRKAELDPPKDVFIIPAPISKPTSKDRQNIGSRVHDFSLNESISISIRVYKISGSIKYDAVFFSGDDLLTSNI